jgi:hypothetical protein
MSCGVQTSLEVGRASTAQDYPARACNEQGSLLADT